MKKLGVLGLTFVMALSMTSTSFAGSAKNNTNYKDAKVKNGMYAPYNVATTVKRFDKITISWSKNEGKISGYVIKMYDSAKKKYKVIGTVKGSKKRKCTVDNLKMKRGYRFQVVPYRNKGKKKVYGYPTKVSGYTGLRKPTYHKRITTGAYIDTRWITRDNGARLLVYRSKTKNGKYKKIANVRGNRHIETANLVPKLIGMYRDKSVKSQASYYYKVRSCKNFKKNQTIYSEYTKPYKIKANNHKGVYTAKMLNEKNSITNTIIVAITSSKANASTQLAYQGGKGTSLTDTSGTVYNTATQYSKNGGKSYKAITAPITLAAGETVYFKFSVPEGYKVTTKETFLTGYNYKYDSKDQYAAGEKQLYFQASTNTMAIRTSK